MSNSSKIFVIVIVLLVGALLYFIFRPEPVINDHSGEQKQIDSLVKLLGEQRKHEAQTIKIDREIIEDAQDKADLFDKKAKDWFNQANQSEKDAVRFQELYRNAISSRDSLAACDSIINVVQAQDEAINALKMNYDSVQRYYKITMAYQDTVIQIQAKALILSDSTIAKAKQAYNGLYKDYQKEVKRGKFNRTLGRILAGAVLVLGGTVYLLSK